MDKKVSITAPKSGYQRIDLGIVRLHFEIGAGKENFEWLLKDRKKKYKFICVINVNNRMDVFRGRYRRGS